MAVPELQPGETALAYFYRVRASLKSMADFTGALALTEAASIAALAVADRNEKVQRDLLAEVKALNETVKELIRRTPGLGMI